MTLYAGLPAWLWALVIAPIGWMGGTLVGGWWPKSARQWRIYGITLACFTVFCVLMICVFHYRA